MSSKNKQKIEYLSLAKAADFCDYSQDYLSLRARSGKLKSKKLGRNWYTTREWLEQYLEANGRKIKDSFVRQDQQPCENKSILAGKKDSNEGKRNFRGTNFANVLRDNFFAVPKKAAIAAVAVLLLANIAAAAGIISKKSKIDFASAPAAFLRGSRFAAANFAFALADGASSFKETSKDIAGNTVEKCELAGQIIRNSASKASSAASEIAYDTNAGLANASAGIKKIAVFSRHLISNAAANVKNGSDEMVFSFGNAAKRTAMETEYAAAALYNVFSLIPKELSKIGGAARASAIKSAEGFAAMVDDAAFSASNSFKKIKNKSASILAKVNNSETQNYIQNKKSISAEIYQAAASLWNGVKNGLQKTVDFVLSPWKEKDTETAETLEQKIAQIEKERESILDELKMSQEEKSLLEKLAERETKNPSSNQTGAKQEKTISEEKTKNEETGKQEQPIEKSKEAEEIKAGQGASIQEETKISSVVNQIVSYSALDESKLPLTGGTISGSLNVAGIISGRSLLILGDSKLAGGLEIEGPAVLATLTVNSGSIFEGNIYAAGGLSAGSLSIDSSGNLRTARIYQDNAPMYITATGANGDLTLSAGRGLTLSAQQTIVDGNFDVLKGIDVKGADLRAYEDLIVANAGLPDKITNSETSLTAYIEGEAEFDGNIYADSNLHIADNIKIGDGTPGSISLAAGSKSGYITGDFEIDGTLYAATLKTPYANTIVAAKSGGDYTTIQAAIDACYGTDGTNGICGTLSASNPALIRVMPGSYSESVTMRAFIDIKSYGGYLSTIITQADNAAAVVATASNSTLEGFAIAATGTPAATTISVAATSPNIFNNKITTAAADTYYAIDITTGSPHIEGNFIGDGTGSRGLKVSGSGSPYVSYNTFYNTAYDLANTGTGTIYSSFNTFRQSGAVNIYAAAGAVIELDNDNYKKVSNAGAIIDLTGSKEYAVSGISEAVGEAVYISAADAVDEAKADNTATMPAIGIIVKKISATRALVKSSGIYYDSAAPFSAGSAYYVSASIAGALAAAVPPQNAQIIGYAKSSSELILLDPSFNSLNNPGSMDYHNVLTVAKSGAIYTAIQAAISACYGTDGTDGDCGTLSAANPALVRVMPGVYTENITMRDYIDIISAGGPEATKITQTSQTVVAAASNSRLEGFTITKTIDDANAIISAAATSPILSNLIISGAGSSSQIAINITTGSPKIKNVEISTVNTAAQATTGSPEISNSKITGCAVGFYQNGDNSAAGTRLSYNYISTTADDIITGAASSTIYSDFNILKGTGDNFHIAASTTAESNNDQRKKTNVNATGIFIDLDGAIAYVEAAESVEAGDVVYINASGQAAEAKADAADTMPAAGIVIKEVGSNVFIKSFGIYYDAGVYADFTAGSEYFVSAGTAGLITSAKPAGEISQSIGRAQTANELLLAFSGIQSGGNYDNVITVAKKGGDYASIQSAVNACYGSDGTDGTCGTLSATNGALIRVMPGSYSEAITMRSWIDVVSAGGYGAAIITQTADTIITGASNSRLEGFTLNKTTDNTNPIISAGASSGTYKNLNIAGAGIANQIAFYITSGSPAISDVKIDNASTAITVATGSPTIINADIFPTVIGAVGINHTGASGATTIRNSRVSGTIDIYASGSGSTINSHSNLLLGTTNFNSAAGAAINSYKDSYSTVAQTGTFNQKDYVINSAIAALTVQQDSTGNIVDFKDGSNSVFVINDGGNVGIGDDSADYLFEIHSAASSDSTLALSDGDVAHGLTTVAQTDVWAHWAALSSSAGGALLTAISDTNAQALSIRGVIGSTDPTDTIPAIKLIGAKSDGSTGMADLGSSETVFQVANNDDGAALTILGDGKIGMGTTAPDKALEINSATGANLRLTYNDSNGTATYYSDFAMSSSGDLTISAAGGDISLSDENLTTTGTISAEQLTTTDDLTVTDTALIDGTLTLATGSITDSTGAISFGDENLTTSGTFQAEHLISTDDADINDNLTAGDIIIDEVAGVLAFSGNTSASILTTSASNNILTLGGSNQTNNENLTLDFETTANKVLVATGTGAASVDFGTINIETDYLDLSSGDIASVGNIAGTGSVSGFLSVSGTTLTDGTMSISGGNLTNIGNITGAGAVIVSSTAADLTLANITSGNILFKPSADSDDYFTFSTASNIPTIYGTGSYLRIGDAAASSHSLDAEDDLMVSGKLEVDGAAYFDSNVYMGAAEFEQDAGLVTAFDMAVSSSAVDNTVEGYNFAVDGTNILTVYSQSDGAGSVDTARVGIGAASPSAKLHTIETTEQLRLGYDASNYVSYTVGSSGDLTVSASGGDISFSDENLATTGNISLNADNALLSLGAAGSTDYNIKWDGSDAVHTIAAGDFVFSGGNVGIGTSGPDRKLDILDASNPQLRLTQADGTIYADMQMDSNGDLIMNVDGISNQIVLDNGGNIGVGVADPESLLEIKDADAHPILTLTAAHDTDYDPQIQFKTDSTDTVKFSMGVDGADDKFKIYSGSGIGDTTELVIDTSGNVGIGSSSPSTILDIQKSGTATSDTDYLELTNSGNAASMANTRTSILFNQWYYDAATPAVADAAKITVGTEGSWTSAASTQDAFLSFLTAEDGTPAEAMRIDSNGDVGIGNTSPSAKLDVLTNEAASAALSVRQDGAGNIVEFKDGATNVFVIAGDGSATIGEATKTVAITSSGWGIGTSGAISGSLDLSTATAVTFKPQTISLVPEYPNSVYYADGSNNMGTLTSDYDASEYHNYYRWTTSSDNQDYDIIIKWLVPEDFNGFDTSYDFKINNKVSDISGNTAVSLSMKDTGNSAVSFEASTTFKNASWTESSAAYTGSPVFDRSTSTTPKWITFQIKLTADNGDNADVGEISFRYNRQQ